MLALIASTCLAAVDPNRLLDLNHAAIAVPRSGTLLMSYQYRSEGMTGAAVSTIDLSTGRFLDRHQAGPSRDAEGFDGTIPWMEDLSGVSSSQGGGNKPALAVDRAYRNANEWWRADRGGARINTVDCNSIEVTPPGGQAFTARFEPGSHLLSKVVEQDVFGHVHETRFANYRDCGHATVAGRIDIVADGDPGSTQTFILDKCTLAAARPRSTYAMPERKPKDWSLPASGRVEVPMRPHDTEVMIEARINGKGPYLFYLDSGGHDIISPRLARELGISVVGNGRSGGAGENTVMTGYAKISSIDAGGAALKDQTVFVLETSPPQVVGELIGGVLGVEFFERFVTSIDYERNVVRFEDPADFGAPERTAAGTPVPFQFYDHMPQVEGSFDGVPANFNIDTGSGQFITLTSPFVTRNALRSRYPRAVTIVDGFGTGGPTHSTIVRASRLTLGTAVVANVPASLSTAQRGAFSDPVYDGNIGNGTLRHFRATFDYPHLTMFLAPVPDPDLGSYGFNRTGVTILLDQGNIKVVDVAAGTPGADAGLVPGDTLLSIGRADVSHQNLRQARQLLKQAPIGQPLTVRFIRNESAKIVTLIPRDLVPQ